MPTRFAGIDEAGYGPNLGPLVMTVVVAEAPDERAPEVWDDLEAHICRAGGEADRLWVDDSKAIYTNGAGRDRLEAACLAALAAAGCAVPRSFGELLCALGAGSFDDVELTPWIGTSDPPWPSEPTRIRFDPFHANCPFHGAPWRLTAVRSVVVGPARFNAGLARTGSKAPVHFAAFARLLESLWNDAADGVVTHIRSDKHGGRHFYLGPLSDHFYDAWVDRGVEGPALSRYAVRTAGRRLELSFEPRADAADGLVALASLVSKTVREVWMEAFNAFWAARIPDLRPTAGYPLDASRFREVIEPHCRAMGLRPEQWWRAK
jgi:hypothetical protein